MENYRHTSAIFIKKRRDLMKRRLLSIIIALTMLLSSFAALTACNNDVNEGETSTEGGTRAETEGITGELDSTDESETNAPDDGESETTGGEKETEPNPDLDDITYQNGEEIKDAGTQWDEDVFALTENTIDESKAVDKTAAELLELLKNKDALAEGQVYRVTEPLVLTSETKYYGNLAAVIAEGGIVIKDVNDVVVKELIIKGDITIENSQSVTFFKIDVKGGSTALSIDGASSKVSLKNCKLYAEDIAIDSKAETLSIYRAHLEAKKGLISVGNEMAIHDSRIVASEIGISSIGEYCTAKNNSLEMTKDGVGIDFGAGSYNGLIALNSIKDTQISIKVSDGFNCVVLLNSAIRIIGEGNTNLYVVDNKLGGAIELKNNEYLLCDGNKYVNDGLDHPTVNTNNTEYNGDNLHDVNSRADYGAKEELLPHTNKDLFVGMERHGKVRDASLTKSYSFNNYMRTMGRKNSVVIVPPGAYTTSEVLILDATHSNTTYYAFGVYQEKDSLERVFEISGGSNITVRGLTVGYQFQSSGQVYVLEKLPDQKLRVVTNAGYINEFGKSNTNIFNTGMCDIFHDEELYPWKSSVGYNFIEKCDDGTMILQYTGSAKEFATIDLGGVLACRLAGDNSRSIYLSGQNLKMKDCVLYGYAAALAVVSGGRGTSNISLERFHNTVHSGYLIDEETYNRYAELEETYGVDLEIYIDEENRYRGGTPRVGSVDATHISGGQVGVNVISSLFESMCDDGSNQRGSSSRLAGYHDNGDGTTTLYYKGTLSQTYYGINIGKNLTGATPTNTNPLKAGDKLFVYASNGHIAFEGNVLTDSVNMGKLPECTVDHGEEGHSHCGLHMYHTDANADCICDDESCKAMLHADIKTGGAAGRDGKCDNCGIKVYTDFNKDDGYDGSGNGKCDVTGTAIVDENGDGIDDVDGTPIITTMVVNDKYNDANSNLTYQALYTQTTGARAIITYTTQIKGVTVRTEDVNFDAFEGYELADNNYFMEEKILFDNHSLNSAGFVFDNTMVRHTRSRGILVKTIDATIKNCTFRDHGMTAILLSVETTWGESTVPSNITVQGCLFDNTGCLLGYENNLTQAPIAIQGLGDLSGTVEISEDTLPCRNINIIGNKFVNIQNNYCITMSAAQGITVKDNVFTARDGDNINGKYGKAIFINGCANVNISGNTYSEVVNGDVTKAVIGYNYVGLTGTDVVDGEGNRLLPEEKDPMP